MTNENILTQTSAGSISFESPDQSTLTVARPTVESDTLKVGALGSFALGVGSTMLTSVKAYGDLVNRGLGFDATYNPLQDISVTSRGEEFVNKYGNFLYDSPNPEYTASAIKKIDEQTKLNEIIMQNPIAGSVGMLTGTLIDPINVIPFMGLGKASKAAGTAIGAAEGAALGAISGAASYQIDPNTEKNDIAYSALFGTAMGATVGFLVPALRDRKLVQALKKEMEEPNSGLTIPESTSATPESAGAAANIEVATPDPVGNSAAYGTRIAEKIFTGAAAVVRTPNQKLLNNMLGSAKFLATKLGGFAGVVKKNLEGIATDWDVGSMHEVRVANQRTKINNGMDSAYKLHKENGGKLSFPEFYREAMYQHAVGDVDAAKGVGFKEAGAHLSKFFDDQWDEAKALGIFSEDAQKPSKYLIHSWDMDKIASDHIGFLDMVSKQIKSDHPTMSWDEAKAEAYLVVDDIKAKELSNTPSKLQKNYVAKSTKYRTFNIDNKLAWKYLRDDWDTVTDRYISQMEMAKIFKSDTRFNGEANPYKAVSGLVNKDKEEQISKITNELNKKRADVEGVQITTLRKELKDLDNKRQMLTEDISPIGNEELSAAVEKAKAELDKVTTDFQPKLDKAKAKVFKKEGSSERFVARVTDNYNKKVAALSDELKAAEDVLSSHVSKVRENNAATKAELKLVKEDMKKVRNGINALRQSDASLKDKVSLLKDEANKKIESINKSADEAVKLGHELLDALTGQVDVNTSQNVKDVSKLLRTWSYLNLMGSNVISQLPDTFRAIAYKLYDKIGFTKVADEVAKNFITLSDEDKAFFAYNLQNSGMSRNGNMFDIQDIADSGGNGIRRKISRGLNQVTEAFSKFTLVSALNRFNYNLIAADVVRNTISAAEKLLKGELAKGSYELTELARFGIDERRAKNMLAQYMKHRKTITEHGVIHYDPNVSAWDADVGLEFASFVQRYVNRVIVNPSVGSKHHFLNSAVGRVVGQFKGYQFGAYESNLMNSAQTIGLTDGHTKLALTSLFMMSLGGMVTQMAKDTIGGKKVEITPEYLAFAAFNNGGILPMVDYMSNIADRYGMGVGSLLGQRERTKFLQGNALEPFLGPSFGLVGNKGPKFVGAAYKAMSGQDLTERDFGDLVKPLPFQNVLYWNNMVKQLTDGK